jgi:hypothetical protein
MEYLAAIFFLGLIISLLVAKGIYAADSFTKEELKQIQTQDRVDDTLS